MKTKYIAVFLCVVGLVLAQGYSDWQQGAAEGLKVGFKMGQAYANSGTDVTGFNAQVDIYNAWVREHFGEDPMLLMQKLNAPVDLTKPVLIANNTTQGGIVPAMDGSTAPGASYKTNDMTGATNVIPGSCEVEFNLRIAPVSTADSLMKRIEAILRRHGLEYGLSWTVGAQPFSTTEGPLSAAMTAAIRAVTGCTTQLSTTGGTSDGRFLATVCRQVVEFGPPNARYTRSTSTSPSPTSSR